MREKSEGDGMGTWCSAFVGIVIGEAFCSGLGVCVLGLGYVYWILMSLRSFGVTVADLRLMREVFGDLSWMDC